MASAEPLRWHQARQALMWLATEYDTLDEALIAIHAACAHALRDISNEATANTVMTSGARYYAEQCGWIIAGLADDQKQDQRHGQQAITTG